MLIVISPAKTLDFVSPLRAIKHTEPECLEQSAELIALMRKKSPAQLRALMGISDKLATLNHQRFQSWSPRNTAANSRPSVLAFMGDVYAGLDAQSLSARDMNFAQKRLRILSGLYGLLRPLDLLQPYRLEMGTALNNPRGKDLYRFWAERPTLALNHQAAVLRSKFLVNLASQEYFKAIDLKLLEPVVITPVFKQRKGEQYKVLSFFAKKARGMMARHLVQKRVRKPDALRDFNADGYRYNDALSSDTEYVFTREFA